MIELAIGLAGVHRLACSFKFGAGTVPRRLLELSLGAFKAWKVLWNTVTVARRALIWMLYSTHWRY